ncbi:transporter substrate-binding protein [Paracoccus stylophorae]|uniref:Transporter substrate-binding protein n=1 Tax=Paracoccus stylophorae TaxID=659350 RepID=A0ABY7SYS1_9RHOB|nr:transporter substrate-binding protein [Paracoccus stylophorae]WCR11950.1 transporter substrate-binding protein [Paracoccus stylophorae]
MHKVDVGLVLSTTGPYGALGRNALAGAQMAINDLGAEKGVQINAHHVDPQGRPELYRSMTADLLARRDVRHLVGGITSWSRKDMIPVLERYGALLWYPCR